MAKKSNEQVQDKLEISNKHHPSLVQLVRLLGKLAARDFVKEQERRTKKQLVAGDLNLRT